MSARGVRSFVKSALAGLVATAADLAALYVLIELCGLEDTVANVPALLIGVTLQYVGNKYYAFEDHSPTTVRQIGYFGAVEVGTFVLNAVAFHLLVTLTPVPYYLARPIGTLLVYLGFSYPLWAKIFRPRDSGCGRARTSAGA